MKASASAKEAYLETIRSLSAQLAEVKGRLEEREACGEDGALRVLSEEAFRQAEVEASRQAEARALRRAEVAEKEVERLSTLKRFLEEEKHATMRMLGESSLRAVLSFQSSTEYLDILKAERKRGQDEVRDRVVTQLHHYDTDFPFKFIPEIAELGKERYPFSGLLPERMSAMELGEGSHSPSDPTVPEDDEDEEDPDDDDHDSGRGGGDTDTHGEGGGDGGDAGGNPDGGDDHDGSQMTVVAAPNVQEATTEGGHGAVGDHGGVSVGAKTVEGCGTEAGRGGSYVMEDEEDEGVGTLIDVPWDHSVSRLDLLDGTSPGVGPSGRSPFGSVTPDWMRPMVHSPAERGASFVSPPDLDPIGKDPPPM